MAKRSNRAIEIAKRVFTLLKQILGDHRGGAIVLTTRLDQIGFSNPLERRSLYHDLQEHFADLGPISLGAFENAKTVNDIVTVVRKAVADRRSDPIVTTTSDLTTALEHAPSLPMEVRQPLPGRHGVSTRAVRSATADTASLSEILTSIEKAKAAAPPPVPENERRISIWIGDAEQRLERVLKTGNTYVINFKVGRAVAESLTTGPTATIPETDIPPAGLETEWLVVAHDAELARTAATNSTVAVEPDSRAQTWIGRFSLLIPQEGDSAVTQLKIKPTGPDARIDVVVTARGEIYRQFKITLIALSTPPSRAVVIEPARVTDEVMPTPTAHLGLSTTHEWTTPNGTLNITVLGAQAVVQGAVAAMTINSIEPWAGVPAIVSGPIKNVRDAAEELRAEWETHLDDIDPTDLANRLQRWGKSGNPGPEYDWNSLGDHADPGHRQQWGGMAISPELRKLAQQGRRLFQAFFGSTPNLFNWIAQLPPGARLHISWTPHAGAGYIAHVPWGLMYTGHIPADGQPIDPMGFLGLRCRLAYTSHVVQAASRSLGAMNESHRTHFLYWGDAPGDVTGQEARWQRGQWAGWQNQVFVPSGVQNAKAELLKQLDTPTPAPTSILYLFCQCNTGAGNNPTLRFGSTNAVANIVTQTDFGTSAWADRPFVFANACTTTAADPYMANELEEAFFDRGCRAYLGTETKVPIVFGSRFATVFFHFFYRLLDPEPMAAGEAVTQARLFLWTHYRNIGGLFYAYVNDYDLFLARNDEVLALRK